MAALQRAADAMCYYGHQPVHQLLQHSFPEQGPVSVDGQQRDWGLQDSLSRSNPLSLRAEQAGVGHLRSVPSQMQLDDAVSVLDSVVQVCDAHVSAVRGFKGASTLLLCQGLPNSARGRFIRRPTIQGACPQGCVRNLWEARGRVSASLLDDMTNQIPLAPNSAQIPQDATTQAMTFDTAPVTPQSAQSKQDQQAMQAQVKPCLLCWAFLFTSPKTPQ